MRHTLILGALIIVCSVCLANASFGQSPGFEIWGEGKADFKLATDEGLFSLEDWAFSPRFNSDLVHDSSAESRYHRGARWSFPSWSRVYSDSLNLISFGDESSRAVINPVFDLRYGQYRDGNESLPYWKAHRGVQIAGKVGMGIVFEGRLSEVQERVTDSSVLSYGTLPRRRIVRYNPVGSNSSNVNGSNKDVYDYGPVFGTVGYTSPRFSARLGRDRVRMGYAMNSLYLSGYASEFDHFSYGLKIGRFNYRYLLGSMVDPVRRTSAGSPFQKLLIIHRFGFQLTENISLAIVDVAIVSPDSSENAQVGFNVGVLNPIIHLRQLEKDFNRFGNKLLGGEAALQIGNQFTVYGQFFLDELVAGQLFKGNGFWANKWAMLGGVLIRSPFGLPAYLRLEVAQARPFTFSHHTSTSSYTHYADVLGHPAGANFRDVSAQMFAQLTSSLSFKGTIVYTRQGVSTGSFVAGEDPLRSYSDRKTEFGHSILQGASMNFFAMDSRLSMEMLPRVFTDLHIGYGSTMLEGTDDKLLIASLGIRWFAEARSVRN